MFPPPEPGDEKETRAWKEYRLYREQNPHVWDAFKDICRQLRNKGLKKCGADFVMREMRWMYGWKIDHNPFPYYTRDF